jgi:hypothetical protein
MERVGPNHGEHMQLPIRTVAFATLTAATWAADAHYRDGVLDPAARTAAVRQVNGDGAATLRVVQFRGNLADDAAIGGTALAAVACLATWRPRPRTVYIDQRTQE